MYYAEMTADTSLNIRTKTV